MTFLSPGTFRMDTVMPESTPAEAVQKQQQKDATRLVERLEQVSVPDLTVSYTLEKSATVLPGLLARFVNVAVLFRLNSAKKWRLALEQKLLPEAVRRWLGIGELADFVEKGTVDWIPPRVFMDTLTWQVIECLTRCGVPQPVAVARRTVGDLLLRGSKVSQNGLVLDRRFWRTFAARSTRPCSAEVAEECQCPDRLRAGAGRPFRGARATLARRSRVERSGAHQAGGGASGPALRALAGPPGGAGRGVFRLRDEPAGLLLQPLRPPRPPPAAALEDLDGDAGRRESQAGNIFAGCRRFGPVAAVPAGDAPRTTPLRATNQRFCD